GPFAASKNLDGCNPIDIFQLRYDLLVHYVAHPVDAPRTAHLKRHEGAVRPREVHLLHAHGKALREGWGNLLHLLLQPERSGFEVHIVFEVDPDGGLPATDLGLYPVDTS